MKTTFLFLVFFYVLHLVNVNAQRFVESECGIIPNSSYTYNNYQKSNFEFGYNLYHNNVLISHQEGSAPGWGYQVVLLKFINDTVGYFVYSSKLHSITIEYRVNKIIGNKIIHLGDGYNVFDLYIVNENLAYLSTYTSGFTLYKCSDVQPSKQLTFSTPTSDITITDTIIGMPLCQNLSEINILYGSINCKIVFNIINSTNSIIENKNSQWKVFPNPADDYISLKTSNAPSISSSIKIFNSIGTVQKAIASNNLSEQNLYVGDLKTGVYIIEINQGRTKSFVKMIKK